MCQSPWNRLRHVPVVLRGRAPIADISLCRFLFVVEGAGALWFFFIFSKKEIFYMLFAYLTHKARTASTLCQWKTNISSDISCVTISCVMLPLKYNHLLIIMSLSGILTITSFKKWHHLSQGLLFSYIHAFTFGCCLMMFTLKRTLAYLQIKQLQTSKTETWSSSRWIFSSWKGNLVLSKNIFRLNKH